jgi:hypothetical protein
LYQGRNNIFDLGGFLILSLAKSKFLSFLSLYPFIPGYSHDWLVFDPKLASKEITSFVRAT